MFGNPVMNFQNINANGWGTCSSLRRIRSENDEVNRDADKFQHRTTGTIVTA
ncbi:hypothetical protein MFFC18_23120 [Mariniblastus fucicola]|uniref:Uncharacterized protein n=1 Tax=Mariniblastus fucicola TaxID=980251 RepID=A0A5B9PBY8_9BACT|nr:hypothetical protein MFFC18_23120 [Mariniblastus fucicola]